MTTNETADAAEPASDAPKRPRSGRATIYDIAELAGVNPSTVSRALSRPGRVSAKTEEKIRRAAAELNFRINPMARALPTGRTMTLAVVVADITNPVVFRTIRGAERAAASSNYTLVIAESQESGSAEASAIERLLPSVDGIVLATTRLAPEVIADIAGRVPLVAINSRPPGVSSVVTDAADAVSQLIGHLVALGHTSIGYVAGPPTSWSSAQRWEALLAESERHGLAVVEIPSGSPTIEGGHAAYRRVIASRVTAVVGFNDLIAIGIMQEAAAAGVRVPDELSVAGFDDIFGSELIVPALTTVRADLDRAGAQAVESLLAQIQDGRPREDAEPMPTELIVRGSTGPASARPL
ncbi:LacI family DNA-binding transcriptional regulator [Microbacterium deminutum]|uniref:LacI family DNA-binding transcriptional regulator n=1 Tax=Microbacterium deminutum TaxID=344164 RepID=A0ABN2QU60_9MICO